MPEGFLVQEGLPQGFFWQSAIMIALCAKIVGLLYSIKLSIIKAALIITTTLSNRWVRSSIRISTMNAIILIFYLFVSIPAIHASIAFLGFEGALVVD